MLDDTSFAIQPDQKETTDAKRLTGIGNVQKTEAQEEGYLFTCEKGRIRIRFYREDIIRITLEKAGDPEKDIHSHAIVQEPVPVKVKHEETEKRCILQTGQLEVEIHKYPVRINISDTQGHSLMEEPEEGMKYSSAGEVIAFKKKTEEDRFYGFGEKTGFLEKNGEKYEMWNSDVYAPHNPETNALYESIPYFMSLKEGRAHGVFFNNTYKTFFDMSSPQDWYAFSAEGGRLDYFVFAGPSPKEVLEQYTYLTGRMPLPPKWAIGYHQSRYSYETEEQVREVARNFKEKEIPLDVIYLDIHYMDGYRVFTFNQDRFPDPGKLIKDLREMGIRVVPIVDPGVKKDPKYSIYQQGIYEKMFCRYLDGTYYYGDVWPGTSAFPDFTEEKARRWWGAKHKFYTDLGIEGIWNDMNEPAVFNETKTMDTEVMHGNDGNPQTHEALHNIYGLLMGKATYEGMKEQLEGKRPFLLTRAGFAGVQRYAAVWTGDNRSFWEHLQLSLPMCMNLGLSGVAFTGPDVGGFAHDTSGELLARWTQVGAFTPYFRNHSVIQSAYQEPWRFGEKYLSVIRKYIELRYQWLPQLYTLFHQASKTGLPVMRPLMLEFPADERTHKISDQFMIGDNAIIAPVMTPGTTDRAVYLPEGEWVAYFTGETLSGGQAHLVHAGLDELPLFVKKGTVLARGNLVPSTQTKQDQISWDVFAGGQEGSYRFEYYDDDGESFAYEEGRFLRLQAEIKTSGAGLFVNVISREGDYQPPYQKIDLNIQGLQENTSVYLDDEKQDTSKGLSILL